VVCETEMNDGSCAVQPSGSNYIQAYCGFSTPCHAIAPAAAGFFVDTLVICFVFCCLYNLFFVSAVMMCVGVD